MLLEKYAPKTTKEFLGNRKQLSGIYKWLKNWEKSRALLLHGPHGVGKSLSIKLVAKELQLEIVESYASDNRGAALIKETLLQAAKQRSMFYKGKIFVIDDAEALSNAKPIAGLIEKSEFPVIVIADDAYSRNLRLLHNYCSLIKFDKIDKEIIEDFLKKIAVKENISIDTRAIRRIASMCNGDLRAALLDLQSLNTEHARDFEENIFQVMRIIFKTRSIRRAKEAAESSSDDVVAWLEENIANEYRDTEEIAAAYDYLSKADLFRARIIKRQSWSLEKFSSVLAVGGVAMSKKRLYLNSRYSPPRFYYNDEKTLEKIAATLKISKRKARFYVNLINVLMKKDQKIAEKFSFDEEDLMFFKK